MSEDPHGRHIRHLDALETYSPPGHTGTVNRKLVDRASCPGYEMILGTLAPGGSAARHHHDGEHQAMYVLEGEAEVVLGDGPPARCPPGTVITIPPGLDHQVTNVGGGALKLIIVYSPPLAPG